ncbi:DMT family transporter [Deinococcus antarcticus]|uniref:DMT family transporter n=1 Tax=Deinococcus antarcticus TaxID=1298767 RepID=A0ABV8A7S7_9DEIO
MTARPPSSLLPLLLLVLGGALLPAQFATNSALAGQTGSVVLASAISYSVGAIFLVLLLTLSRQKPDWAASRRAPWWAWLGGVIGSAYVVGSVILTQQLGAALATTLVIASQLITATLLDHFGALGLPRRPMNPLRAAAVGLALAALALRFWGLK